MRTRREQMQAYRFVIRRIVAAMLHGEPESLDRPLRRLGVSVFVSVMVGLLGLAAFGVYGLIANPGGELEPNTLVIERGTGAGYVYLDGRLHPVLNLASARLILGEPAPPRTVSPRSLVDTPRGPTLGIPHAPVALPEPRDLVGLPWRVCNVPPTIAQPVPSTTVVIHQELPGLAPLTGDHGLYVAAGETGFLLWNHSRLLTERAAAVALQLPQVPIPVGEPLINTVGAGPDLAAPDLPDHGEPTGLTVAGEPALVGDVFEVEAEHYLLTGDGLARLDEVSWTLLRHTAPPRVRPANAPAVADLPVDEDLVPEGFPRTPPRPHPAGLGEPAICSAYVGPDGPGPLGTRIEVLPEVPEQLHAGVDVRELAPTDREPVAVADRVLMSGGRAALVQAVPHTGAASEGDTVYLVTDQGVKYPLATAGVSAREALGYGGVDPVRIPGALLAMLPTGPQLSQPAALRPADLSGQP